MKMRKLKLFAGFILVFLLSTLKLSAQFRIDYISEGGVTFYARGTTSPVNIFACESFSGSGSFALAGQLHMIINGVPHLIPTVVLPLFGDGFLANYSIPSGVRMVGGTTYSLRYTPPSSCSATIYSTPTYTVKNEYFINYASTAPCLSAITFTPNHFNYLDFMVSNDISSSMSPCEIKINGIGINEGAGAGQFTKAVGRVNSIVGGTVTIPAAAGTYSTSYYNSLISSASTTTYSSKTLVNPENIYEHIRMGPMFLISNSNGSSPAQYEYSNNFSGAFQVPIAGHIPTNGDVMSIVSSASHYSLFINSSMVYSYPKTFTLTSSLGTITPSLAIPGQSVLWSLPTNTTSAAIVDTIKSVNGTITYVDTYTIYPVPTFTSPVFSATTICSGTPLNINLGSAISTTYSWSATNNSNTTGESTTIQVSPVINNTITNTSISSQNLVYTITPQSSLAGGCLGTAKIVTVTVNPVPTINSITSPTICSESTLNIPISSSVAATYSWLANNNPNTTGESTSAVVSSTINNTIINTSGAAQLLNYTITPQASIGGCFGSIRVVPVTVNPKPQLTTVTSTNICSGNTFSLNLTSSTPSTYTWIATDNANITGEILTTQTTNQIVNTLTNNVGSAQSFYYVITPTGTIGLCTGNTQSITLTVYPTPTISVSGSTAICSGSFSNLLASGASTYLWSDGSTSNPLVINPTTTGNYTVVGTNTLGCIGSNTIALTVNPMPVVNFSLSIDTICEGGCVTFTNSSSIVGDVIASYNWNFADGSFSNIENPIHCYTAAGLYNVSLTATTSNSCSVTFTNSANPILVGAQANANFDYSPESPLPVNTLVTFNNSSTNATTYNWFYGDGNGSSDIDPTYTYNNVGNYLVTLIAYNASGCNDTISKSIEIKNALFIPDGFTPDGDIKNENFVILGLESYPDNELKVFNRWGNLVYSKKQYDNSWAGFPNVSSASFGSGKLPAATYFYILELNKGDEKPKTGFVVMQY